MRNFAPSGAFFMSFNSKQMNNARVDVLIGLQWGDEGKGKIVDVLAPRYNVVARFQGGPNAGHTIEFEGKKFVLHTIPSGIFNPETINLIGNGVIVDPLILQRELNGLEKAGHNPRINLYLSRKAHLILPTHRLLDAALESAKGADKIGSTLKGIGPTYTDKVSRHGLRIGDLETPDFVEKYNKLRTNHLAMVGLSNFDYSSHLIDGMDFETYEKAWLESTANIKTLQLVDSEYFINDLLSAGKTVLAEGAQGSLLDIDFGSYPFVTSSNTTIAGVCSGLGIPASAIGKVLGVFKAYCTRVGSGPFPTELFDETGALMRERGREFGSTTGRARRCGWLDLPALNYAIILNGVTDLVIMKPDVLDSLETINIASSYNIDGKVTDRFPFDINTTKPTPVYETVNGWMTDLKDIRSFDELPAGFKAYVSLIEQRTGVKVSIISTGPDRTQTIWR
jgi:adenylosuccinate synthase